MAGWVCVAGWLAIPCATAVTLVTYEYNDEIRTVHVPNFAARGPRPTRRDPAHCAASA
jgi:hypothetical protein